MTASVDKPSAQSLCRLPAAAGARPARNLQRWFVYASEQPPTSRKRVPEGRHASGGERT